MTMPKGQWFSRQLLPKRIMNALLLLSCVLWFLIVVPDYLFNHPYYAQGLRQFAYAGLICTIFAVLIAVFFSEKALRKKYAKKKEVQINGLKLYLLFFLVMNIIVIWYGIQNNLFDKSPLLHLLYFSGWCLLLHAAFFLILLIAYALGSFFLQAFSRKMSPPSYRLVAIAIGLSVLGFVLSILGLLGALYFWSIWPVFLLIGIWRYRSLLDFSKTTLLDASSLEKWSFWKLGLGSLLLIFVSVNSIGAIKAFPVGFDGAGLYMNTSNLIATYHALPQGGQAFAWSLIMSLGQILFGSTTVAILLSHLIGILCLFVLYRIARLFLSSGYALLTATLFYTAPWLTYHNYFDEKVDLGFLFISLSTLLLFLEDVLPSPKKKEKSTGFAFQLGRLNLSQEQLLWIYLGWLSGFAFSIKYTALFNIVAFGVLLFYQKKGALAYLGSLLIALAAILGLGVYRFTNLDLSGTNSYLLSGLLILPGIFLLYWTYRQSLKQLLPTLILGVTFLLAATAVYTPWASKNLVEKKSFNLSALVEGKSPRPKIGVRPRFRDPNKVDPNTRRFLNKDSEEFRQIVSNAGREETQRYQGYEKGLPLYLSLPYDLTMNTNLPNLSYLDLGFLFLLVFPLLLIGSGASDRNQFKSLLSIVLITFIGLMALLSVYVAKASPVSPGDLVNMPGNSLIMGFGGIYESVMEALLTMASYLATIYIGLSSMSFLGILISLLLLFIFSLWLAKERIDRLGRGLKKMMAFLSTYLFLWLLLGNAIPWYAFTAFALLPIVLVYYLENADQFLDQQLKGFSKYFLATSMGLYLFFNLILHFNDPARPSDQHLIFKNPFFKYVTNNVGSATTLADFNLFYLSALQYLNADPSERIYRVGTYLNYHIVQNDQRVLEDNQLATFESIQSRVAQDDFFFGVLRQNRFRYILYDFATASIDKTPEQSLIQKNNEFINLLIQSQEVELLVTDRIIEDPGGAVVQLPSGTIPGKPGLLGRPTYQGTFALFKIR